MCDTNVFHGIADDPDVLVALTRDDCPVRIVLTHVQRDEIAANPDGGQRERLQRLIEQLPRDEVPTFGFVIGVSRLGMARFGEQEDYDAIIGNALPKNRSRDALIAMTAKAGADVLVTEDVGLRKRAPKLDVAVWSWAQFRAAVLGEAEPSL